MVTSLVTVVCAWQTDIPRVELTLLPRLRAIAAIVCSILDISRL